jgi:hypothetical protein
MAKPVHTKLKGVTHVWRDLETQTLLNGAIDFLEYAFLEVGAFQNISVATSGVYGGDRSRLRPVTDPRYTDGQVWEGFRGDWVWESGLDYGTQPIGISGVYVNGSLYKTYDGTYGHYVDYPRGRVVFDTAIAQTSQVKAEFSHRTVHFVDAEHPFIRRLMYESYHVEKRSFLTAASGHWNTLSDCRLQLPCVGIQIVPHGDFTPYALGGGQWGFVQAKFHVFADNTFERDQIADIIARQNDKTIWIANRGVMKESGIYPPALDYKGALVASPMQYPEIVADGAGWQWRKVAFSKTSKESMHTGNDWLHASVVTTTFEIPIIEI